MKQAEDGHRSLVIFTSLAIAGAGAIGAGSAAVYDAAAGRLATQAGLVMLVGGLAASTLHLGRRDRALLAVRGLPRSPISLEGALGGLTVALAAAALTNVAGASITPWVRIAGAIAALAFLGSVGLVYRIGGQLTWSGWSALTPVTAGLAFGAIFADSLPPSHHVSTLTIGAIALDAFVFSRRWRQVLQAAVDHQGSLGPGFERRHEWLGGRFFLLDVVPCLLLFVWPTPLAALVAGAGLVADRAGFYALALQHRTEVEINRIERLMDRP
jgi:hypothetical protein